MPRLRPYKPHQQKPHGRHHGPNRHSRGPEPHPGPADGIDAGADQGTPGLMTPSGQEPARSLAAGLLNRFESTQRMLDEVLAEEFARRGDSVTTPRRFRAKTLVAEVVRRRLTLDQILKVYSSRPPELMERPVRTALRMALAEWFFVEPLSAEARPVVDAADADAGADEFGHDAPPPQRERSSRSLYEYDAGRAAPAPSDGLFAAYPTSRDIDDHLGESRYGDSRRRDSRFGASRDEDGEMARDPRDAERSVGAGAPRPSPADIAGPSPVALGPIVNAAVTLVGHSRPSRGFVNGVLRAIDRDVTYLPHATIGRDQFPRDMIPASVGGVFRFGHRLFSDPEQKPAAWLSQFASLPKWLATRFISRYGLELANAVGQASNALSALSVRVNTRKTTPEKVRRDMEAHGYGVHPTPLPEVFRIFPRVPLVDSEWFKRGDIYLQDLTPCRVAHATELKPGMRVLDACSAPGGKITHICERLNGKGTFVSLDVSARRLELVKQNLTRLGHSEIQTVGSDLRDFATTGVTPFDLILVDAPCSNTGVLARRADVRWRLTDELQQSLMKLQLDLLHAAVKLLAPKGTIIYSTCTLEPEENRGVAIQLPGTKIVNDELWLPEAGIHDGGYICVLQRTT